MTTVFLTAFGLGLLFSAAPGAIFAETVKVGVRGGFRPALAVQVGSLVGDALWAVLGLAGVGVLLQFDALRVPTGLAGVAYLLWLSWDSWREADSPFAVDGAPEYAPALTLDPAAVRALHVAPPWSLRQAWRRRGRAAPEAAMVETAHETKDDLDAEPALRTTLEELIAEPERVADAAAGRPVRIDRPDGEPLVFLTLSTVLRLLSPPAGEQPRVLIEELREWLSQSEKAPERLANPGRTRSMLVGEFSDRDRERLRAQIRRAEADECTDGEDLVRHG